MKALVYKESNVLSLENVEDPIVAKDEVLIRVRYCGICGSDVHGYMGITGRRNPGVIMGHEFSGEIARVGDAVRGVAPGDRVTAFPLIYCGECDMCRQKRENLCANRSFLGVFSRNGAMAEYVVVPEKCVVKLPDAVSLVHGALIEPYAVGYRAVRRANIEPGQSVLIVGAGTIGLMALVNALGASPKDVLVSDISEYRLSLARELGAHTVNPGKEDVPEAIRRVFETEHVDVAIEAVGVSATVVQAVEALRDGGTCVCIGNTKIYTEIPMQRIVTRELAILGTHVYTLEEFRGIGAGIGADTQRLDRLVSRIVTPEEAGECMKVLAEGEDRLIKVLIDFSCGD